MKTQVLTGQLIDQQWQSGDGEEIESVSPSDGSIVWSGNAASKDQVSQATAAARQAFGTWWDLPSESRIQYVQRFAELVKQQGDDLAELISREMGKPLWESKTEVAGVVGKAALSIEAFQTRRESSSFEMGPVQAVTRYKPFGVLGVIGPFNFPAHLPNGHIIPALLSGNTVVFKPSEQTPAVGQWMAQRWLEAELPQGVLNLVQGGRETGVALSSDSQLDGLLFTGGSAAGRALHQTFSQWPQKMLALEMGGNNPLIIHRADDLEAAAYFTIVSAFITAGQRCSCARRLILVEGSEADALLSSLREMIAKVHIGFWNDQPEPFAATVVSAETGRNLQAAQERCIASGAKAIVPMRSLRNCDALLSPGVVDVTEMSTRSDDEMFGPLLQVIRVPDFDAAIHEANHTQYGLSAGLISNSRDCYDQFIHQIRAGIVNWNRPTTGASGKLPFGGCGLSGNNRPSGYFAADYCNWPVASMETEDLSLPEAPMTGIEI